MTATFEDTVGNSVSGGENHGTINQYAIDKYILALQGLVAARALDAQTVLRIQRIHVRTEWSDEAARALKSGNAVALLGPPGSGRSITGIRLLADLGVTPRTLVLDLEDLGQKLEPEDGHGYLLDLEEVPERPRVAEWIRDLAARVHEQGTYLVVRARAEHWRTLGLDAYVSSVTAGDVRAIEVFAAHLKSRTHTEVATDWAHREAIIKRLTGVRPPEAVRLAELVDRVRRAGVPEDQQLDQVLQAYANWTDTLTDWFERPENGDGHRRVMLITTAALGNGSVAEVYEAARLLTDEVGLQPSQGDALIGPEITEVVGVIDARLDGDRITFTRPAYADAVLDHVWVRRPQLRRALKTWLAKLPKVVDDGGQAARRLVELGIRQNASDVVTSAAESWAASPSLRPLAVVALTEAAMSDQIGRAVRRRLYEWACSAAADEALHLAVAQVCSGQLAEAYPQIALTRLRHLAVRSRERVKAAAIEGIATLASRPRLRNDVLLEVSTWVRGEEPRRSSGHRAFARLAELRDQDGRLVIVPEPGDRTVEILAELWRAVLRSSEHGEAARRLGADWLDAAQRGQADPETVIEILAGTVTTSRDLATLTSIVVERFSMNRPGDSDIGLELLRRAHDPIDAPLVAWEEETS